MAVVEPGMFTSYTGGITMKRTIQARSTLFTLALAVGLAAPSFADTPELPTPAPAWAEAEWAAFSTNLVHALASDNEGLKASALQMIVRYGDHLDVRAAEFDVVRLFRSHRDERVRRLAAVACTRLKSRWAVGFLRQSESFERSERVRGTIRALLAEADAR